MTCAWRGTQCWQRGRFAKLLGQFILASEVGTHPLRHRKDKYMNTNSKGNIALGKAISYFTENEYIVSLPLNDSQCYDLIIEKNGVLQTVQVKYTSEQKDNGNFICRLQTKNQNKTYYSLIDTFCEFLYCFCSNGDQYLIPIKEIKNSNSLTLFKEKSKYASKDSFDSSQYLIK